MGADRLTEIRNRLEDIEAAPADVIADVRYLLEQLETTERELFEARHRLNPVTDDELEVIKEKARGSHVPRDGTWGIPYHDFWRLIGREEQARHLAQQGNERAERAIARIVVLETQVKELEERR